MSNCKSFKPLIDNNSKVLILGSMPSVKSIKKQQYYAHPQNRFWEVIGNIYNSPNLKNLEYSKKIQILLNNNIALWDIIKSCNRIGSLDSNIQNEKPNNIIKLLKQYQNIKIIYLNGNKSYLSFKKYFPNLLEKYTYYKMPSTSPTNARYNLEKLISKWSKIIEIT